jgi:hypothetical protein
MYPSKSRCDETLIDDRGVALICANIGMDFRPCPLGTVAVALATEALVVEAESAAGFADDLEQLEAATQ